RRLPGLSTVRSGAVARRRNAGIVPGFRHDPLACTARQPANASARTTIVKRGCDSLRCRPCAPDAGQVTSAGAPPETPQPARVMPVGTQTPTCALAHPARWPPRMARDALMRVLHPTATHAATGFELA